MENLVLYARVFYTPAFRLVILPHFFQSTECAVYIFAKVQRAILWVYFSFYSNFPFLIFFSLNFL